MEALVERDWVAKRRRDSRLSQNPDVLLSHHRRTEESGNSN